MNNIIGEQTNFILVREEAPEGAEKLYQAMYYNEYNFTLTPVQDVQGATKFDDVAVVNEIAQLQTSMARLMKKPYTYFVVQEDITRHYLGEGPIV